MSALSPPCACEAGQHGHPHMLWCPAATPFYKKLPTDSGEVIREVRTVQGVGLPTEDADRKRLQMWTFLMEYFPDVFLAVLEVSIKGNEQHNPGQPLHWAREKSTDQLNTAFRHMWDHGRGIIRDKDGAYHLAKAIWRLSAELQLLIEKERRSDSTDGT